MDRPISVCGREAGAEERQKDLLVGCDGPQFFTRGRPLPKGGRIGKGSVASGMCMGATFN